MFLKQNRNMSPAKKRHSEELVRFQLRGIDLLDICFIHPKQPVPPRMVFKFDIKLEHKIPSDNNLIAVVVTVDIREENKTDRLGSIMASCVYEVPDINDYIDKNTNLPKFPEEFIATINSVSISTVRGIMFAQFRGTFLHNAVLPVVDPKSFVPQT